MLLRSVIAAIACAATLAWADAALTGSWTALVDGQRVNATFDGKGGGQVDGRPIRYQVKGNMLLVEDQGEVAMYQFQVQGGQLMVAGGQLPGMVTFSRGTIAAAPQAAQGRGGGSGGGAGDLVGKWCKSSSFTANAGGGSQSSACFELRADGSYTYGSERSASAYGGGAWGGTSGSSGDSGRWTATATSITAHSRSGQVSTYQLQKRNHPKNRDPMLCLDGECYTTYWRKAPW
ncbi:hypothetical protein FN976_03585 [Caenimonas sedimenti]|uniref:Uncharacterized protein n=1 Tax=Caenimonas sedimenti TaxID=2596921 RepID=A0A562ZW70_9BURK|nr:hypothetical protein [Caenimonas sedimenti]TWO72626.1 hypothetical protein FN976_03585 [Caenimonas sedimenti]